MSHRILTTALTLLVLSALLVPFGAEAHPGHWRTEEEFLRDASTDWERIAPGVYELRRDNGRVTQVGFGVESFRFALEEARAEEIELLSKLGVPGVEKAMRATEDLIAYLEDSLARADRELSREEARLANKASSSGSACTGTYALDVTLSCNIVGGTTKSTASWTDAAFGPYIRADKTLYTYARAATSTAHDAAVNDDSDRYGPFNDQYHVEIQSQAGTYSSTAFLSGRAHLSITNGCSDFRFVTDFLEC